MKKTVDPPRDLYLTKTAYAQVFQLGGEEVWEQLRPHLEKICELYYVTDDEAVCAISQCNRGAYRLKETRVHNPAAQSDKNAPRTLSLRIAFVIRNPKLIVFAVEPRDAKTYDRIQVLFEKFMGKAA